MTAVARIATSNRELGQLSVAWTPEHTDRRSKVFLRGLPFDLRFELGGHRIRLVHGSPREVNEYLIMSGTSPRYRAKAAADGRACQDGEGQHVQTARQGEQLRASADRWRCRSRDA